MKYKIASFLVVAILGVFAQPGLSYADWGRHQGGHNGGHHSSHFYRHHDRPQGGLHVSVIPNTFLSIRLGEARHRYHDRSYYVSPQRVTVVQSTPVFVSQASAVQIIAAANTFNGDDLYMINIPNDRGGHTSVTIKRSGSGFVGPQGEYYTEFPQVFQLKAMYVK